MFTNVCHLVACSLVLAAVRLIDTNFGDFENPCPGCSSVTLPACFHPWGVLQMLREYVGSYG